MSGLVSGNRPQGMYDRSCATLFVIPDGEKFATFTSPTTLDGYRAVYRAYLHDPDLRMPRTLAFVNMWDNHEFSWLGWQCAAEVPGKNATCAKRGK